MLDIQVAYRQGRINPARIIFSISFLTVSTIFVSIFLGYCANGRNPGFVGNRCSTIGRSSPGILWYSQAKQSGYSLSSFINSVLNSGSSFLLTHISLGRSPGPMSTASSSSEGVHPKPSLPSSANSWVELDDAGMDGEVRSQVSHHHRAIDHRMSKHLC